jgi:putative flippase GtrA
MRNLIKELLIFGCVGCTAMLVHFICVVYWLVPIHHINPTHANIIAFAIAFQISYWGHRCITFNSSSYAPLLPHKKTLPRFFGISLLGFIINQSLYVFLLTHLKLNYDLALFYVLIIVAVLTFILSKCWAFSSKGIPS